MWGPHASRLTIEALHEEYLHAFPHLQSVRRDPACSLVPSKLRQQHAKPLLRQCQARASYRFTRPKHDDFRGSAAGPHADRER